MALFSMLYVLSHLVWTSSNNCLGRILKGLLFITNNPLLFPVSIQTIMASRSCTEDQIVVTILRRRTIMSTGAGRWTGAGRALDWKWDAMLSMCIEDTPSLPIYNLSYWGIKWADSPNQWIHEWPSTTSGHFSTTRILEIDKNEYGRNISWIE